MLLFLKKRHDRMERRRERKSRFHQRDVTAGDTVKRRWSKISLQMKESGGGKGQPKLRTVQGQQQTRLLI